MTLTRFHLTLDVKYRYVLEVEGIDAQDALIRVTEGSIDVTTYSGARLVERYIEPVRVRKADGR
jgi:hypothetical protein